MWLDLDQAALGAVQARLGAATTAHEESAFYDTADLALHRAGVRLEVVRAGGRSVQRITLPPAPHRRERRIHEADVVERMPDRDHLRAVLPPTVAAALNESALERLFALRYTRSTAQVPHERPVLEVVLDRGVLAVAGTEVAFTELMMADLGGGDSAAAAAGLLVGVPARLTAEDRWHRGFRIAAGVQVRAQKNRPIRVEATATVGDAAQLVLQNAYQHFLRNLPAASLYGDVEAVHQMRVGLRRLRAFRSVFRRVVGAAFSTELEELQRLFAALAEVRECDVFLESTFPLIRTPRLQPSDRAAFEVTARLHRASAVGTLRRTFDGPDLARVVSSLALRLQGDGWRNHEPLADLLAHIAAPLFAVRRIRTLHRRLLRARPERRDDLAGWHRARVRGKKVRYALEPLQSVCGDRGKRLGSYARSLERLQESLGLLNDLRMAADVVARLVPEGAQDRVAREIGIAVAQHHDACVDKLVRKAARTLAAAEQEFPRVRNRVSAVAVVGPDREANYVAWGLAAAWSAVGIAVGLRGATGFPRKGVRSLRRHERAPRSVQRMVQAGSAQDMSSADLVLWIERDRAGQGLFVLLGPARAGEQPQAFPVPPPEMANYQAFAHQGDAALPVPAAWLPLLVAVERRLRD